MKCAFGAIFIGSRLIRQTSVEAARRMTSKYDFVVTSGGIGPTHDGKYSVRMLRRRC